MCLLIIIVVLLLFQQKTAKQLIKFKILTLALGFLIKIFLVGNDHIK
jgi:hypothetical protein